MAIADLVANLIQPSFKSHIHLLTSHAAPSNNNCLPATTERRLQHQPQGDNSVAFARYYIQEHLKQQSLCQYPKPTRFMVSTLSLCIPVISSITDADRGVEATERSRAAKHWEVGQGGGDAMCLENPRYPRRRLSGQTDCHE